MTEATHLAAVWRALATQHANRLALVDTHGTWSYRDLHARIVRLGNALRGLGLRKGERVALLAPDLREYLEADYATMAAGLVRVPLDPRLTRTELVAMLHHAGASAVVTHASFADKVRGLADEVAGLRHIITVGGGEQGSDLEYEALV